MNVAKELQEENRTLLKNLWSLLTPNQELDVTPIASLINDESVHTLSQLTNIRVLHLEDICITHLNFLTSLKNLEVLDISGTDVKDLSGLKGLTSLKTFIAHDTPIYDLSPLSSLLQLKVLKMERTNVSDLEPLRTLKQLEVINLYENKRLQNIEPLGALPKLKELSLKGTGLVMPYQLHCLQALTELKTLDVDLELEFMAEAILMDIQQRQTKNFTKIFLPLSKEETVDTQESEKEIDEIYIYNLLKNNEKAYQTLARNPSLLSKVQELFLENLSLIKTNTMTIK